MTEDVRLKTIDEAIIQYAAQLDKFKRLDYMREQVEPHLRQDELKSSFAAVMEMEELNRFEMLLTIAILDILVICKGLSGEKPQWETLYFVRKGYTIIYETINNYHNFNFTLKKTSEKYLPELNPYSEIIKDIRAFKTLYGYEGDMKNIRNYTGGHIDKDLMLFYSTLLSIDLKKAFEALKDFSRILMRLQEFVAALSKSIVRVSKLNTSVEAK